MAKPSAQAQQSKTVQEWIDSELRSDAQLRREVEETLTQMRIEEDLATLRERRQVSQSQLAKLLGVSQPAIAKLESGKAKNLELRTLVRYATVLGARVRVVIEEDAPRPKMRRVSRLAVVRARKAKAS
jgi:predicted XRE-type DNA-binding protein